MIRLVLEPIINQPTALTASNTAKVEVEGQGRQTMDTVIVGDRVRRLPTQQFAEVLSIENV